MRLTSLEADLQASVQDWMCVAQLRMKQRGHEATLKQIISGMGEHFATTASEINRTRAVFYVIMGVLSLVFAVAFPIIMGRMLSH